MRRALAVALLSGAVASASEAQRRPTPRVGLLFGAGVGEMPDFTTRQVNRRSAAANATAGLRVRPASHATIDASLHLVGSVAGGDDIALLPIYTPGVTYRQRSSSTFGADMFTTADVRAGFEAPTPVGGLGRASLGGGYMWEVARPYGVIAAGIGSGNRRGARVTLDLEYRRFSLPVDEFTVTAAAPYLPVITGRATSSTHATFVRFGLEAPLRR